MDFAVNGSSGCHNACVGIDREQAIEVAGQRVGDRVGCRVEIECVGGNADSCSDCDVLIDAVRGCIGVGWLCDIELVNILDGDRETASGEAAVGRSRTHRDTASPTRRLRG